MNRKEFENIVPELRPLMVKVARDFFGNQDDAEDVAQDALVRLWNYCERLDANRNMKQLAIMVTKNCCIDTYKRRQMMVEVPCPDERMAGETYQADGAGDAGTNRLCHQVLVATRTAAREETIFGRPFRRRNCQRDRHSETIGQKHALRRQGKLEKKSRDRRICRHEGRQGFGRSGRKRNAVRRAENHEGV